MYSNGRYLDNASPGVLCVCSISAFLHSSLSRPISPAARRELRAAVAVLKQPSSNCIETYGWPCTCSKVIKLIHLHRRKKIVKSTAYSFLAAKWLPNFDEIFLNFQCENRFKSQRVPTRLETCEIARAKEVYCGSNRLLALRFHNEAGLFFTGYQWLD